MSMKELEGSGKQFDTYSFSHTKAKAILTGVTHDTSGKDSGEYVREAFDNIPEVAKWPTFSVLLDTGNRARAEEARAYREQREPAFFKSPKQAEVVDYAKKLSNFNERQELPQVDKDFFEDLVQSRVEYDFEQNLHRIADRIQRGTEFLHVFQTQWNEVQAASVRRTDEPKDKENLSTQWTNLRENLNNERAFEKKEFQRASEVKKSLSADYERRLQMGLPVEDPRIHTSDAMEQRDESYQNSLNDKIGERIIATEEIKDQVDTIRENDPIATAQVLWDSVLNDEDKAEFLKLKEQFSTSEHLIAEASKFKDYKDPAYRAFLTEIREKYDNPTEADGWDTKLTGVERVLDPMEKILIGDFFSLPTQTQKSLQDPEKKNIVYHEIANIFREKQTDKLRGYVADVSLALLMSDIAKPQEAS